MVSDCQEFNGGGFSLKVSRVVGLEQWGAGLSRPSISLCVVLGPFHELYLGWFGIPQSRTAYLEAESSKSKQGRI